MSSNHDSDRLDPQALIASLELFDALSAAEIAEIVDACEVVKVARGAQLFRQGSQADALYIVAIGEVQVQSLGPAGANIQLATLGAGSVVGEISLIGGGVRSASVEVTQDATLLRLSHAAFHALREAKSMAAYRVVLQLARILGERRRRTEARVNEVFADPAEFLDDFESQVHDMLGRLKKA